MRMGRILECIVLLSHLLLVLGIQYKNLSHGSDEREKQDNVTQSLKEYLPKEQNEFFNKRMLEYQGRRRSIPPKPKQMISSVGLHAYADNQERRGRKRNSPNTSQSNVSRKFASPYSRPLHQRKNSKNFWSADFHGEIASQKLTKVYPSNNLGSHQTSEDLSRSYYKEGRNARYSPRYAAKLCDPCNSIPWVPLIKVPDSYRKQRTHVTELHPTPQDNLNLDFHGFASNTQNILIPPVPLIPSIEPIYDGTISSSFGLPIGNIPTSHGLLAPININKYPTNTFDYSNPFNYFSPHGLLDNHPFPELSPVPVVPIHDSGQFYQFDSVIPDLVPPPSKPVDVSKVVLTIDENSADLQPPKLETHSHNRPSKDLSSDISTITHLSHIKDTKEKKQHKDLGKLEIVKSIPLAEFTTSISTHQQDLPLYPPLQSENKDYYTQRPVPQQQYVTPNYHSLVPPERPHLEFNSNKSDITSHLIPPLKPELHGESSAPKPLTNPSLSWLFSDHTAPPSDSKSVDSVSSYSIEATEIASVVNNELRPVSPVPLPTPSPGVQNRGNTKSKKIQIIIPYTTKNKNGHDNNAIESVQHEIYQPPVSEINALRDLATSSLPPSETNKDRKVIDGFDEQFKTENQQVLEDKSHKYLSEMHHIIASNIRELLKEEIEKSQGDQNYPLQNNIDNWTALEYSNHKTVNTKAPKEIINQAIAVTSIPGTSISHLLLPSKKIPNEYFVTTPLPNFDEPNTPVFRATNSTVNSSPFTAKPYATTSIYNPIRKQVTESPLQRQTNHETNYTEIEKGKTNNWGRLNENLVLPEARSKTRRIEPATTSGWNTNFYSFSGNEKVQIVTPISLTTQNNHTTTPFRRTTRHIHQTESPTTPKATTVTTESSTRKPLFLNRLNSTRLEKVSNQTSPFNRKFTYNSTTITNIKSVNASKNIVKVERTNNTVLVEKTTVIVLPKMETSSENIIKVSSKNESLSINDIIPFRNKELPWESNSNSSEPAFRIARQRKSLIKQANLPKTKIVVTPT